MREVGRTFMANADVAQRYVRGAESLSRRETDHQQWPLRRPGPGFVLGGDRRGRCEEEVSVGKVSAPIDW